MSKPAMNFVLHPQNVSSLLEQLPQAVLDLLLDAPGNASTSWPTMSARRPCPTARWDVVFPSALLGAHAAPFQALVERQLEPDGHSYHGGPLRLPLRPVEEYVLPRTQPSDGCIRLDEAERGVQRRDHAAMRPPRRHGLRTRTARTLHDFLCNT